MQKLGAAGPMAVGAALFPLLGSLVLFANAETVSETLRAQGAAGWVVFVLAFAVLSGLALLPTYAQSGMAGYIFGVAWGAPGAVLGCVGGAMIGYGVARLLAGQRVRRVVDENPKWKAVADALLGRRLSLARTIGMVALIRLPPNSPFAMTNLALAGLRVRPDAYVVGSALGIAPRTIVAAFIGAGIQEAFTREAWNEAIPRWLFYTAIVVGIGVVVVIGQIAMRAIERASVGVGNGTGIAAASDRAGGQGSA